MGGKPAIGGRDELFDLDGEQCGGIGEHDEPYDCEKHHDVCADADQRGFVEPDGGRERGGVRPGHVGVGERGVGDEPP